MRLTAGDSFKAVAGGYIFTAPSPWIFGHGSQYLVDDAQKAALLALMKPRHLRNLVIWLAIVLFALAASAVLSTVSGHDQMMTRDALTIAALTAVPLIIAILMVPRFDLRRLQPILSGASRAEIG
jgi:hypothetical protein